MFISYRKDDDSFTIHELTRYEFLLIILKRLTEASFSELRKESGLQKSTLHFVLQQLRKQGLINTKRNYENKVGRPSIVYAWNDNIKIPTIDEILNGVL